MRRRACWLAAALAASTSAAAASSPSGSAARPAVPPFPQPYAALNSGAFSGPAVPASRDPLVSFVWNASCDFDALQVFSVAPTAVAAAPSSAATRLPDLIALPFGASAATVAANATLMIDFGVEHGAWLELLVPPAGVPPHISLAAAISEYDIARPGGAAALSALGGGALRLVTNPLLFDGLRYAWLSVAFDAACDEPAAAPCAPLQLLGVRATAQILPLNYGASFASSDALVDRIFYTGAYAVRVNMQPHFFGSELLDRGDRPPPFQGDAHVAQAVGLAVFASPPLYAAVRAMLATTDSAARPVHDSSIATYPLMFVLSLVDYFTASGDAATLRALAADAASIVDSALANFSAPASPPDLRWSGWDARLGEGFADVNTTPEARRLYWMTTLRAAAALGAAAGAAGGALAPLATKYAAAVAAAAASLRRAGGPTWYAALGYHASAAAINGGWPSASEAAAMFAGRFNDSALACSLSNYDTGFLLDALGALGHFDYAKAMLALCWGRQLAAGATCWWESTYFYDAMLADGGGDMDLLPGASTSACHAWGSFPTAWAQRHLLGIRAAAPGFARVTVAPALGLGAGWLQSLRGVVPTPHGSVALDAALAVEGAGRATLSVRLTHPRGTAAELHVLAELPEAGAAGCPRRLSRITLDGVDVPDGAAAELVYPPPRIAHTRARVLALGEAEAGRERVLVATYASAHECVRSGRGAAAPYPYAPYAPPTYPRGAVAVDNQTHGSWLGAHGRDGYVLFGYAPPSNDVVALPAYVANVSVSSPLRRRYANASSPGGAAEALLESPPTQAAAPRALGAAYTVSQLSWLQAPASPGGARALGAASASSLYALHVDVELAAGAPAVNVSLYLATTAGHGDISSGGESVIVHWVDLVTRNALVPDTALRQYIAPPAYGGGGRHTNEGGLWGLENGVYLTATLTASSRAVLYCVSGCYASVSAVFFDAA